MVRRPRERFVYNNDPEKTKQTFNERGWSTLWDVGHLDEDGYLYLTDRKLFMIVSGGVNIYPQEIEDVLVFIPPWPMSPSSAFRMPKWVSRSRPSSNRRPVQRPGRSWPRRSWPSAGRTSPTTSAPARWTSSDAMPRGENGKLYKRQLRDAYWANPASSTTA